MLSLPNEKPKLSTAELHTMLSRYEIDRNKFPLIVIGIRGYYLNTMGDPGKNDRGIYDDALFLDSPNATAAFNANVDPSVFRPGIASLVPGLYMAHCFGYHKGQYLALVQKKGEVIVTRDGIVKPDKGYFGINIHKGGLNTTSSLGCQTIHPSQWNAFINLAASEAKRLYGEQWMEHTVPYVLLENLG